MNPIAQPLLWCCLQVTVLALAALAMGTLLARRRPAAACQEAACHSDSWTSSAHWRNRRAVGAVLATLQRLEPWVSLGR